MKIFTIYFDDLEIVWVSYQYKFLDLYEGNGLKKKKKNPKYRDFIAAYDWCKSDENRGNPIGVIISLITAKVCSQRFAVKS